MHGEGQAGQVERGDGVVGRSFLELSTLNLSSASPCAKLETFLCCPHSLPAPTYISTKWSPSPVESDNLRPLRLPTSSERLLEFCAHVAGSKLQLTTIRII